LTLDDGVEQVARVQRVLLLLYGIEIPEHGSGSELFFSLFEQQQNKQALMKNESKIIEQ
jgi:hypothetical protein